jgi:hypothetical protein
MLSELTCSFPLTLFLLIDYDPCPQREILPVTIIFRWVYLQHRARLQVPPQLANINFGAIPCAVVAAAVLVPSPNTLSTFSLASPLQQANLASGSSSLAICLLHTHTPSEISRWGVQIAPYRFFDLH